MNGEVKSGIAIALLSAWVGAALLLAASVAPAAFAALPARTLAGDVIGRVLPVVFVSGVLVAIAVVLVTPRPTLLQAALAALIVLCGMGAQFLIAPRIASIRESAGVAIDALSPTDPRRVTFGQLHAASVGSLGVAMAAALILLILSLLALRQRA